MCDTIYVARALCALFRSLCIRVHRPEWARRYVCTAVLARSYLIEVSAKGQHGQTSDCSGITIQSAALRWFDLSSVSALSFSLPLCQHGAMHDCAGMDLTPLSGEHSPTICEATGPRVLGWFRLIFLDYQFQNITVCIARAQ